jgi:hypothetical protein
MQFTVRGKSAAREAAQRSMSLHRHQQVPKLIFFHLESVLGTQLSFFPLANLEFCSISGELYGVQLCFCSARRGDDAGFSTPSLAVCAEQVPNGRRASAK